MLGAVAVAMMTARAMLAVACVTALVGAGGRSARAEAPSARAEARTAGLAIAGTPFTCVQISDGRPARQQTVVGTIDATGVPSDIAVFRGPDNRLEHSAAVATSVPGYQGGRYEQLYRLLAWNIGSAADNDYFLLLPSPDIGVLVTSFSAQLHVYLGHGGISAGGRSSCPARLSDRGGEPSPSWHRAGRPAARRNIGHHSVEGRS